MKESPPISLDLLRSNSDDEWRSAYPFLWRAILSTVHATLGPAKLDAENLAAEILGREIIPGVFEPKSFSFNQIRTFDDLLNVSRAVARNRTIDFIRRNVRRPEVLHAEVPEPLAAIFTTDDSPDLLEIVRRHLSPPDPELFHDRFVLGLTTREIATRRQMSHGTVVSRFARALEKLRQLLSSGTEF